MKTVTVSASRQYDIRIGSDLIPHLADHLAGITKANKFFILSDSNVWPVYGQMAVSSLLESGYDVYHYIIPAGEASKCGENFLHLLNLLAENQLTRSDCIIALGGGVVGDLAGFVAATYLRGIAYVQIPTSLLAMVDSSVGGKTAIDLPAGKNLAGAFYQPSLVLCDLDTLQTLPENIFRDGCAEVIKYGILFDSNLFSHLKCFGLDFNREYVVTRCVELKRDIVNQDERDLELRQLLNLGHTIAHSIEANSNYGISHGKAVAIGMDLITACAVTAGLCNDETYREVNSILLLFQLPTKTLYKEDVLAEGALHDKKRASNTLSLIIPKKIGECIIHPYPIADLKTFIKAGLTYADLYISR